VGGRLAISDVVATQDIPEALKNDVNMVAGCIGGAASVSEVEGLLKEAGFSQIKVQVKEESRNFIKDWAPGKGVEAYVASATIEATKGQPTTLASGAIRF
jgi:hypothetical protein